MRLWGTRLVSKHTIGSIDTKLVRMWNRLGIPLWWDASVYRAKHSSDAYEAGVPSVRIEQIKAHGRRLFR